jgi:hypothetical protein
LRDNLARLTPRYAVNEAGLVLLLTVLVAPTTANRQTKISYALAARRCP